MTKVQARALMEAKARGLITESEMLVEWLRMGYTTLVDWITGQVVARVR
jgi:hypothetical protein